MEFLRDFKAINKDDVPLAGGKGASLGEMTQAGIPVPPGFVILASAFEKFLEETDLNVEIDSILHSVNIDKMHTIEDASEKIHSLVIDAEIPIDIATEIQKFFKNLNSKYVAVRSSATAEDSASAAWAGQLDSFLNTTEETLLENVKKCWVSLFTPRAIFYRFEKNLHEQKISVAVVVQKMVESEKSGIAFSVHPVTQDKNQLIIEAGLGLGEAIVSGQITPDSYVVEKQPRWIIDKNIQVQTKGLYRAENGGNEWCDIPKKQGEQRVLSDEEILEFTELIVKIENHYGFPCDVEWAFDKDFFIVQSRPITTLRARKELISLAKIITREAPLIGVESWYEGIVNENERFFEIKFPENFFIFRKGTVESWRDTEKLAETPVELSEWARKNQKRLVEGYRRQKETLKTINDIKKARNATENEILVNLDKIRSRFVEGFPGIVVTYLMPLWQEIFAAKEKKLFDEKVIEQCSEWRNETDQFFDQSIEAIFFLLDKIATVKKWDKKLLKYIGYQELILALKKQGLNRKELLNRSKSIFAYINGRIIFEKDFKNELQKIDLVLPKETVVGLKEIKGNIANKGFVSGKVKVVFSREELDKVDEGDILVAPMTTPWYLPAMKKAAAFVTDEGGVTSHAAIVAREMNKPCVIGTKVATQILSDNITVEVDAGVGVVRILK